MIAPTLIKELVWKGYLIFMCMNLSFIPVSCPYTYLKCIINLYAPRSRSFYYRKETNDERQIVYKFYPETANLTLEGIDDLFIDGSQGGSQPDLHPDAKEPAVREVHCTA